MTVFDGLRDHDAPIDRSGGRRSWAEVWRRWQPRLEVIGLLCAAAVMALLGAALGGAWRWL